MELEKEVSVESKITFYIFTFIFLIMLEKDDYDDDHEDNDDDNECKIVKRFWLRGIFLFFFSKALLYSTDGKQPAS